MNKQINPGISEEKSKLEIHEGNNHPLLKFDKVISNLENATLEDVTQQLNYYNGETVLINGVGYHPFNDPQTAARLNARYRELTGQDHPIFAEQVPKVIDRLFEDKALLIKSGSYTPMYFDNLQKIKDSLADQKSGIEIYEGNNHPLLKFHKIISNLENATLEDITQQLNYFNGESVLINGTYYHPFNDPQTAARLNTRYRELTGQDHPTFVKQAPKVIDDILQDEADLIKAGIYSPMYLDNLKKIKESIPRENEITSAENLKTGTDKEPIFTLLKKNVINNTIPMI